MGMDLLTMLQEWSTIWNPSRASHETGSWHRPPCSGAEAQ
ncbi:unnamed protein product [Spirodela intermedia]|uniref:Uncharacterized protein n=2 Tax=Spirodela intermedia TaxID=51605 RepID=A0A7I8JKN6_SPIIN|nr:unnamed protein product [Spirodela intermedia]CAA6670679.1 unnamed protein product [Spirodela intermedia]CAA7407762.1 unnamed protein product [Spirodela intermedia]